MKNNFFKNDIVMSIAIAGMMLAFILILQFAFENVKIFGGWGIQIFLIVYAISIWKIKNIIVNIIFMIITPPLLFVLEQGVWAVNGLQVFFEYFLVYYIFALLYIPRYVCYKLKAKFKNKYLLFESIIFIISFTILIIIKFLLHSIASLTWWDTPWWSALVYNSTWLATNILLVPIASLIVYPIFKLFDKFNVNYENKW